MTFPSGLPSGYRLLLFLFAVLITAGCGGNSSERGEAMILVSGDIVFEEGGPPYDGATVYVRLEDVSRADAASTVVAEQTIRDIASSDRPIPFRLTGEPLDERASYIVSAHVDVDGDGTLSPGDYLTMESYPVTAQGDRQHITIRVRRLK